MGQSAVLLSRRPQTVLRLETLLHEEAVPTDPVQVHALLHTHLVRGLVLFRLLSRRPLQLFCHREL